VHVCSTAGEYELTSRTCRVALLIQIHLAQNRLDLAQQEVRKAKSWAQDALLVNIAEAWVGLREVCYTVLYCTSLERRGLMIMFILTHFKGR